MPTRNTIEAFIARVISGGHVGAIRDWYHDDAWIQENQAPLIQSHHVRAEFILVAVDTSGLARLGALFDDGTLQARVGETLPLSAARNAHEMLAGRPHKPGKIVMLPGI